MELRTGPVVALLGLALASSTRAHGQQATNKVDPPAAQTGMRQPEQPIPQGYRMVRKRALGIVGVSLLGGGYALSAITGAGLLASCHVTADGTCRSDTSDKSAALLLVPLAGPFLALTRSDMQKDGGTEFFIGSCGAMQVVGLGLLTYYLSNPRYTLERIDDAHVTLLPLISRQMQGLSLSAQF